MKVGGRSRGALLDSTEELGCDVFFGGRYGVTDGDIKHADIEGWFVSLQDEMDECCHTDVDELGGI